MSEQGLIDIAQTAVGDSDTVVAAAWFQPRGTSGGTMAGMEAGNLAGNMAGGGLVGIGMQLAGTAIGFKRGRDSGGFEKDPKTGLYTHRVPSLSLLAVSDANIYAWKASHDGVHHAAGELLFALPRSEVEIAVRSRVSVRTFEVVHAASSEKWEFESGRVGTHSAFLLDALHKDID